MSIRRADHTYVCRVLARASQRGSQVRLYDVRRFVLALGRSYGASALRAVVDGAFVTVTLRRRGLGPLLHDRPDLRGADPDRARRVAEAVDAGLGLLPVAATCLRRSVTLL